MTFADRHVRWRLLGKTYHFELPAYKSTLAGVAFDHSWEDIGRCVERILTERVRVDDRWPTEDINFDWVSTRCSRRQLTYSFTIGGQQVTFATEWDGQTEEDAVAAHDRFFLEKFADEVNSKKT